MHPCIDLSRMSEIGTTTSSTMDNMKEALNGERGTESDIRPTLEEGNPYRQSQMQRLKSLVSPQFYQQDDWIDQIFEILFKLKRRGTTIKAEVYFGVIHFISCAYILPVMPQQLAKAGYNPQDTVVAVALCAGVGSILSGLFSNLPFVLAPPTVVSIFLSVYLQQNNHGPRTGSIATIFSGLALIFFGWRPLGRFVSRLIPLSIQAGTAIGIGLMTALAGSTEIDLVQTGQYVVLKIGAITPEICIAFAGVIFICIAMRFHWTGSFCLAVVGCSITWWAYDYSWPTAVAASPHVQTYKKSTDSDGNITLLAFDLLFLYILYLNGLLTSLGNLAVLTRDDKSIPRSRWIYIICGVLTVMAGLISCPPILVSPESSASIKEGAKTGLSAVVAGVLFLISLFFAPILQQVPAAATSPLLIMIGVILFQNTSRVDWRNVAYAAPAFIVLFYIPFTYSILQGVLIGFTVYLIVSLFTGEMADNTLFLLRIYLPHLEKRFIDFFRLHHRHTLGAPINDNIDEHGSTATMSLSFLTDSAKPDESHDSIGKAHPHDQSHASNYSRHSGVQSSAANFSTDSSGIDLTKTLGKPPLASQGDQGFISK